MLLRAFAEDDVPMVLDLANDPYVPLIGTLPAHADEEQARDWIHRQLDRWDEGAGYSFAVAEATTGERLAAPVYGSPTCRKAARQPATPSRRANKVAAMPQTR